MGMSGGYVATALVMLMSPVFFPVLAIIAPVQPCPDSSMHSKDLLSHIKASIIKSRSCGVLES